MNKKLENINDNIDTHHLGLYIKEARLRQGYRLTEVAQGICAISVLSRIESGAFEPTPALFEKLSEKLEMKFPKRDRLNPIASFKTMIYRHQFEEIDRLFNRDQLYDYEKPLFSFLVAVKKGEMEKAETFKKVVDKWAGHLNLKEKQMYTLFNAIYFFSQCEWEEGADFLEQSYKIAQQKVIEDPLLEMEIAKYYFKVGRSHLGFVFLDRAYILFQKFLAKKSIFECLVIGCDEYIKLGELNVALGKIEQLHHFLELDENEILANDILSLSGRVAQLRKQPVAAENIFSKLASEKKEKLSESCLISIVEFYYERGNLSRVLSFIDGLERQMKMMSHQLQTLLEYYYYKATDWINNDFEIFLLDDAIPQAMEDLNSASIMMYMKDLVKFYEIKKSNKGIATTYQALEAFRNRLSKMKTMQAT